jgi:hypothetical protein
MIIFIIDYVAMGISSISQLKPSFSQMGMLFIKIIILKWRIHKQRRSFNNGGLVVR